MTTILNPQIHAHLIDLGFVHTHYEADWFDGGDAENGPKLEGGPCYDEYDNDIDLRIYVDQHGIVVDCQWYDAAMEKAQSAAEQAYWDDLSAKTGKSIAELEADFVNATRECN